MENYHPPQETYEVDFLKGYIKTAKEIEIGNEKTLTQFMFVLNEGVRVNEITEEGKLYCINILRFRGLQEGYTTIDEMHEIDIYNELLAQARLLRGKYLPTFLAKLNRYLQADKITLEQRDYIYKLLYNPWKP